MVSIEAVCRSPFFVVQHCMTRPSGNGGRGGTKWALTHRGGGRRGLMSHLRGRRLLSLFGTVGTSAACCCLDYAARPVIWDYSQSCTNPVPFRPPRHAIYSLSLSLSKQLPLSGVAVVLLLFWRCALQQLWRKTPRRSWIRQRAARWTTRHNDFDIIMTHHFRPFLAHFSPPSHPTRTV